MKSVHCLGALVLALAAPAIAVPAAGTAHPWRSVSSAPSADTPRISAFAVAPVARLQAGSSLHFELRGTPGVQASVRIDGAHRLLGLAEVQPGTYRGVYTVGLDDRIAPDSTAVANLRHGELVGVALLEQPLQRVVRVGALPVAPAAAAAPVPVVPPRVVALPPPPPRINSFAVSHGGDLRPAAVIRFELLGTPGGWASVELPGAAPRRIALVEERPGEYVGRYDVQPGDRIDPAFPLTARLQFRDRSASTQLAHAFDPARG